MNRVTLENNWGVIKPNFTEESIFVNAAYLLRDTIIEYVRYNTNYSEITHEFDFPMGYGELQNQGVLFYSFNNALTSNNKREGSVFSECQYELNKYRYKKIPEKRRIDYWVLLKTKSEKDTVLLVEYKHRWANVLEKFHYQNWADNENKHLLSFRNLASNWKDEITKLQEKATKYSSVRQSFLLCKPINCKLVTMVLMTVPVCQDSLKKGKWSIVQENDFACHKDEIIKAINPEKKPNWDAYWWLPEEYQKKESSWVDSDGLKHYFHYIGMYFLARLDQAE